MKKPSFLVMMGMVALTLAALWGCQKAGSFLDKKVSSTLNEATVFSDSARTMDFLASIYEGLFIWHGSEANTTSPDNFLDAATDQGCQRYPSAGMLETQVVTGSFGGSFTSYVNNSWSFLYTHIRQANIYLKDVNKSPLSDALKQRTSAEARFLRAYFYYCLMEGWGGVPIINDTIYDLNSHAVAARSTYSDCVDYVLSELDAVSPQLPLSYSGLDYGRITRGACLALKANLLLTAASPLFNGGSIATDENLKKITGYPVYDASRWQKALKAAQDVVSLGTYHLEIDNTDPGYGFYQVFLQRVNPEYILAYMMGPNVYLETYNLPPSRSWWNGYHRFPTQELVDAFPMANGLPIGNVASGYQADDPYANRDPRFYYSIIYNGSEFYHKSGHKLKPVWTYDGAPSDGIVPLSSGNGTHTGYYYRKMMNQLIPYKGNGKTERCLPIIRYAEILLDVAEAANESGNTSLAMDQLIQLRQRAGIAPGADGRYGIPANPTQDSARHLIHNERFIELAFEGHRFMDLRRWKDFSRLAGKYTHGMRITKSGSNFTYERIELRKHEGFSDKLYLFPLPENEVSIDRHLLQNPGW